MKIVFTSFVLLLLSCSGKQEGKLSSIRGIWIPRTANWQEGDFSTYCFLNDTTAVVLSSVQKNRQDSIYFATEPGFNIKKGIVRQMADGRFSITGKTIYRFIKLTGADGKEAFQDTVAVDDEKGRQSMMINGVPYVQGDRYTQESKRRINDIMTKMVPDIENHPEKFN